MPNNFPILVNAGGSSRSTAKLMKTGQTTSYRTGDDGDLERGRDIDFFTLAENNPFGNTNRFTDELGGQDYTNNIVIDWSTYDGSTVLGWYNSILSADIWDNIIDAALLLSVSSFTSGWRLSNMSEILSISYMAANRFLNYTPFNNSDNGIFWTSTTYITLSTQAMVLGNQQGVGLRAANKTSSYNGYACRDFTVTGTTLT